MLTVPRYNLVPSLGRIFLAKKMKHYRRSFLKNGNQRWGKTFKVSCDTRVFSCACSLFSTALFGVPFPLPTPQGRWDRQLRDVLETEI